MKLNNRGFTICEPIVAIIMTGVFAFISYYLIQSISRFLTGIFESAFLKKYKKELNKINEVE